MRVLITATAVVLFPAALVAQNLQVLTQHNDNARTGANLAETVLNVATVSSGTFGLLYSLPVDGQVYAQPLYMQGLQFGDVVQPLPARAAVTILPGRPPSGPHNVLYVATMHNSVYAFDADDPQGTVLWRNQLNPGPSVPFDFMPMGAAAASLSLDEILLWLQDVVQGQPGNVCQLPPQAQQPSVNISPEIGITSTPVIDPVSRTLFVVNKTLDSKGQFAYYLHALDLLTGFERPNSPVSLSDSVDPMRHLQRPALLLSGGAVYIAFGAHQDTAPYHGWILAYDAQTLHLRTKPFSTTPNGSEGRGGIWQSGNGLAADTNSNVYAMTGNGPVGGGDYGDSFIKLNPQLGVIDYFTPGNWEGADQSDVDLGSAGPLLLPGGTLLGGGKTGVFYLLDQGHLGGLEGDSNAPLQEFQAAAGPSDALPIITASVLYALAIAMDAGAVIEGIEGNPVAAATLAADAVITSEVAALVLSTELCGFDNHHIHGSPVVWSSPKDGPMVYVWAERDYLKAFKYDPAARRFSSTSPAYRSSMEDPDHGGIATTKFMPGAVLSVSANGSSSGSGIVWASLPAMSNALASLAEGVLRAFDAEDVSHELWCAGTGTFAKFAAPTVANGRVYLATFDGRVNVYGLGATAGGDSNLGGYRAKSSPFVADGYVYFQAAGSGDLDNRLYKVSITNPNGDNTWLGGYRTKSPPFVADGYAYFQASGSGAKDNRLYKVSVTNPNGDNTWLGGYKTNSTPFVADGYVYFQGSGNRLFKVSVTNPNGDNTWLGGYKTNSTPFVADGYVYFQGSGNRLYKVSVTNPNGDNTWLGGYKTKSTPFVANGYVYFQGTDDRLFKVSVTNPNGDNTWLGGYKTKSAPFVDSGYVYFQADDGVEDDAVWRVPVDGSAGSIPGCNSQTLSTPFATGGRVYYQATDNRLMAVAD
jgi:hypothetical protein